ncbi:hypothetical protein T03_15238 [Trichinella britovi]|uniref:Uncharacterized protein n=1 Tax=Trichinella britovi TaxID=45882 RepID=A0A0V1D0F7_TRIBR|nr:hypothetical protein T03_15238 [Trichinella britovi]
MFQKEEQNVKLVMSKLDFHVPYFTECFTLSYQFAVVGSTSENDHFHFVASRTCKLVNYSERSLQNMQKV